MGAFSEAARIAGLAARKKNAKLRKQGKLPPIQRKSIPLDSPLFDKPPKPSQKATLKPKPKAKELADEVKLRIIALLERLL